MSHQQFIPTVNVQWNGVATTSLCHAIRITSHITVTRFMHTVNIHRNSAAIRYHSSLLNISPTFHAHSECCWHKRWSLPSLTTFHTQSNCPPTCCDQVSQISAMPSGIISDRHVSLLPQCFMHTVNVHWNGVAIRYHQSLPCFIHTVNVHWNDVMRNKWSLLCLTSLMHTVNIQWISAAIRDHQPLCFTVTITPSTQWISSEILSPSEITSQYVSQSPTPSTQWLSSETVSPSEITSHCLTGHHVSQSLWLQTQRISSETVLPSEIKHHLTVTMTEAHSEYPVKRCHHQKSFRNHLYVSCKPHVHHECLLSGPHCFTHRHGVSTEIELPWGITIHHSLVHTVLHTHTEGPLKWCCHPRSPITVLLCHTQSIFTHSEWF